MPLRGYSQEELVPEYIPIRAEVLVLIVGIFLYLTDLGRLLYANEILLVGGANSKWSAITPADGFIFNRRYAVFPRPHDPGTVVMRFLWPTRTLDSSVRQLDTRQEIEARLQSLFVPRVLCTLLLPEIFLGIPLAYSLPSHNWPTFGMILFIYVQIICLVVWLLFSRNELQLPWKFSVLLAFESLVCPPYAINLHRKVAMKTICRSGADILDIGECLLAPHRLNMLRDHIRSAIDDRLEGEQDIAKELESLVRLRSRLNRVTGHEPE